MTIVGNHSLDAIEEGIELQGASHCVVNGNVVRGCGINGILLWNSTGDCRGNEVSGNTVSECGSFGILVLDGAHENAITGNTVARCGGFGIAIDNSTPTTRGADYDLAEDVSDAYGNAVTGNVVVDNRADGIRMSGVSLCAVAHNVVRGNNGYGIYANSVSACSIRGNVVSANARSGILVDMADGVCNGNVCASNGPHAGGPADAAAISIHPETRATSFAGNRCVGSAYGIAVRSVADTTLDGNVVDGNRRSGVVRRGEGRVGSPLRRSLSATVGSSRTAVRHGLPFVPSGVAVLPHARGEVWQPTPPDERFVYLESDREAMPVEILVG
jgi:parallel beta-helix repeat protein